MAAASIKPGPNHKRADAKLQRKMGASASSSISARAARKRVQVASFSTVLRHLLGGWKLNSRSATIVDFGCGSGNLVLPLAALFPNCTFIGKECCCP